MNIEKLKELKERRKAHAAALNKLEQEIVEIQRRIPNMTHPDAPISIFENGKMVGFTVRKRNYSPEGGVSVEVDYHPVTPDHIERAERMIGVGLDAEQVSQWLANDDVMKEKMKEQEEKIERQAKHIAKLEC